MFFKLALAFVIVCAVTAQILPPTGIRITRPGPVIETRAGYIQGQQETYDLFRRINTYKGIRYGTAPLGIMRFRQSSAPLPYIGVFQAWQYGVQCPQFSFILNRFQGEEDCLFLNIATPINIRARLPVVFSIHGGGLQFGHGEMSLLGPEYINQDNVIFVSFNYRLNVLGFLNTGDASSPGNYGLKDMILALQWVRDNIEFFGGNPDDVTIHGISGGAVAVHALVISPVATGLFHKAIAHSGSLFNSWAFNNNPLSAALRVGQRLQLQFSGVADLVNQLRQVSVQRLLEAAGPFTNEAPVLIDELRFMPSIDPIGSPEPRIIPAPVQFLVKSGNINTVPFMVGFNAQESLNAMTDISNDPTILERFNQNPHLLVPVEWNIAPGSAASQGVIATFRNLYFGGATNITTDLAWEWSQYISDREFIFGISKQARLHALSQNVYYYRFSYTGSLSFAQRLLGLGDFPGALHGDDAFYLFRLNFAATPVLPGDEAFAIQRRQVRLWTNFYKFGNPTPTIADPMINALWPRLTANEDYMDIRASLVPGFHPNRARMDVWHALDNQFT